MIALATIRRLRGRWQAVIRRSGSHASRVFDTKGEARAWAAIEEPRLAAFAGRRWTLSGVMDAYLRDVVPQHKGARWETIRIAKLRRQLAFVDAPVQAITPADITAWARASDLAPASVRREAQLIGSIFTYARKSLSLPVTSPVRDAILPKNPKARDQRISDAQRDAIVAACGYVPWDKPTNSYHRVALAFLFALETAMRAGEIVMVRPALIHGRVVHLPDTKNGTARDVPLSPTAQKILELVSGAFKLTPATRDELFRRVRARAAERDPSIAAIHFHDTRREAATRLSKKLDVMELARMGGWRDIKVLYARYYAVTAEEIADKL